MTYSVSGKILRLFHVLIPLNFHNSLRMAQLLSYLLIDEEIITGNSR